MKKLPDRTIAILFWILPARHSTTFFAKFWSRDFKVFLDAVARSKMTRAPLRNNLESAHQ